MDLLASAGHDAVVSDERWLHLLPHPPTPLDDAIRAALDVGVSPYGGRRG